MKRYLLPPKRRWRALHADCARAMDRARVLPSAEAGAAAQFRDALQWPKLPWAAALGQMHGLTLTPGRYLGIELLSLRPEPNGVYVVAAGDFVPVAALEFVRCLLEPWLLEDGCAAWVRAGSTYLSCLPESLPAPDCEHGDGVLGAELSLVMPTSLAWQRRLNEAQMALNEQAGKLSTLANSALAINSAWYFDAGAVPNSTALKAASTHHAVASYHTVPTYHTEDAGLRALLKFAGSSASERAEAAELIDLRAMPTDVALPLWQATPGQDFYACGVRMVRSRFDAWRFWRRENPRRDADLDP